MPELFLYAPSPSPTVRELMSGLEAKRLRLWDGLNFRNRGQVVEVPDQSVIVNWGGRLPNIDGCRIINGGSKIKDKWDMWYAFATIGVNCPTCVFNHQRFSDHTTWIPRRRHYANASDFLNPPVVGSFYTRQFSFTHEYRVHLFNGRCLKAGVKTLREGYRMTFTDQEWRDRRATENVAHPWWKSFVTGWTVDYSDFTPDINLRKRAKSALEALKLTFGAVDVGLDESGHYYVLDVNTAPSIDSKLMERYIKAFQKYASDEPEPEAIEPEGEEFQPDRIRNNNPAVIRRNVPPPDRLRGLRVEQAPIVAPRRVNGGDWFVAAAPQGIQIEPVNIAGFDGIQPPPPIDANVAAYERLQAAIRREQEARLAEDALDDLPEPPEIERDFDDLGEDE